jgi:hypothetical protein
MLLETLTLLRRGRFDLSTEVNLKRGMAQIFKENNLPYEAEYIFDEESRPDFYYDGITIEVKIKGTKKSIYKQCERYCKHPKCEILILVTNKSLGFPPFINDKPCYVVNVGKGWL